MLPKDINSSWLKKKVAHSKLDEEILADIRRELGAKFTLPDATKPFIESQCKIILSQREAGDEIFWFKTPENKGRPLTGREGYALIRSGRVIAVITTWIM